MVVVMMMMMHMIMKMEPFDRSQTSFCQFTIVSSALSLSCSIFEIFHVNIVTLKSFTL